MAVSSSSWIPLLETFVNPDNSPDQQAASLDAIPPLLHGGQLTIQAVVSDMEIYLTTTDNAVRARGILLLAEILSRLRTKPLEDSAIHSLTLFFTSRLADWPALRGAVIGCLALLKRKSDVGLVSSGDVKKLIQSYMENLQVQALAQQDRMLCLELLECLLDAYADAISSLGDDLVYGVCAAIDEEKDPRCLLLAFHIVELLVHIFPDPEGPLASCAEDLFDIISRYFPISFNPPPNDSLGITREDLSRALLGAFMSSPLFAPFSIPLLLEKLSSSLRMAKVDSLKYLGKCTIAYGVDAVSSHTAAIWDSLKNEILTAERPISEAVASDGFADNEVLEEALTCLTDCVLACHKGNDTGVLLELLLQDEKLEGIFRHVKNDASAKVIPSKTELGIQVQALGRLLSATAKSSFASCFIVSQRFLPRLLDAMGAPLDQGPGPLLASNNISAANCFVTVSALYICDQIVQANRILSEGLVLQPVVRLDLSSGSSSLSLLQCLANPLTIAFASAIPTHNGIDCQKSQLTTQNEIIHLGVAGLQALASFPGSFSPLTEEKFKEILLFLMSVLSERHEHKFLWEQALGALVQIGISLEKFNDSARALVFVDVVIVELLSQLSIHELSLPILLKLKAITSICCSSSTAVTQVLHGFRRVICGFFFPASVKSGGESEKSMELVTRVLECLSSEVLVRCKNMGVNEEDIMSLSLDIWNCVQEISRCNVCPPAQVLEPTMAVMRLSVQYCTEELQKTVLIKAIDTLPVRNQNWSNGTSIASVPHQVIGNASLNSIDRPNQDEWKIALFASVVVSLRPKIVLHNKKQILEMFISTLLGKGDSIIKEAACQALGSMINKCPVEVDHAMLGVLTLDQAIHSILEDSLLKIVGNHVPQDPSEMTSNNMRSVELGDIHDDIGVQIQAVTAVAWIGKGLAMRGHGKISDVAVLLLNILRSSSSVCAISSQNDNCKIDMDEIRNKKFLLAQAAADGLGIIMKDSKTSLNKDCYACIRPLYKQRFFTSMIPILVFAIRESGASPSRYMLYCALAHLISEAPHIALLAEAEKVIPYILEGILVLSNDAVNKGHLHSFLLALSGIIVDENYGRALVVEHVSTIISRLAVVVNYPYSMIVRETALQCLGAMVILPYTRIFPMRAQVLKAVSKALDDRKRSVRKEAVRCHHVWASIASRSPVY